jgi:hypothetical protein
MMSNPVQNNAKAVVRNDIADLDNMQVRQERLFIELCIDAFPLSHFPLFRWMTTATMTTG